MPDDYHHNEDDFQPRDEDRPPGDGEPPASVIFTQMIQQAAEQSYRPPTNHAEDIGTVEGAHQDSAHQDAVRQQRETALQEHRIQRVQRRRARRRRRTVGVVGGFFRTILIVLVSAGLMATIFSFFTNADFLNPETRADLQVALATSQATTQPTGQPTPPWMRRIGIVAGHRGPEGDPGAVCPDGLTEAEINFNVAELVVQNLQQYGYGVDLLDEFDPRLDDYQAEALLSIHANTCQDFGEHVSGFMVSKAASRPEFGEDTRLAECLAQHYAQSSGLERLSTLTRDMTDYHTFREIHPLTPAATLELGFMRDDRLLLTEQPDVLSRGITDGILCFLEPELVTATPAPTATAAGDS